MKRLYALSAVSSQVDAAPAETREFDLHVERVRLRAMRAAAPHSARPDEETAETLASRLARIEAEIAALDEEPEEQRGARLARVAGLDPDELDLLWTVVAAAMDSRVSAHLEVLWGTDARRGVSPAMHVQLAQLDGARGRRLVFALAPERPLLRRGLLADLDEEEVPACRPLSVPPRVAAYLAGSDVLDDVLAHAGGRVTVPDALRFDDGQEEALRRLAQALGRPEPTLIVLEGPAGVGRRTATALVAAEQGHAVLALDVARLLPTTAALESGLEALARECLLGDALPLLSDVDELGLNEDDRIRSLRALARALDGFDGTVVVTTTRPGLEINTRRPLVRVRLPVPDTATRRALWIDCLGEEAAALEPVLDDLAARFRLGAGGIARATATARLRAQSQHVLAAPAERDLIAGVCSDIEERMSGLAQRIEPTQSWDDLVLTDDTLAQIHALVARVRYAHQVYERWGFRAKMPRGTGVAALFSGPPGTGKSMVAGIIARELELDLYQVDLSQVVSKWVGETEKQLAKLFDAAEAGHALLLFDEADALFAKRTEVKSSIDRYANLEVNYLLQRIESHGGVTILTTNLEASIDPAVRRRLAGHIVFWPPDVDERIALWARLLPPDAPLDGRLDFEVLADTFPDMTGAHIRNAVLAAAFLAAAEGTPIRQEQLERAARGEYRAMGRVIAAAA